jgi:hypothetical protein
MREFYFWCIQDDIIDLVNLIISLDQFTVIADKDYYSLVPCEIKEFCPQFISDSEILQGVYLYSKAYSIYPPYFTDWICKEECTTVTLENGLTVQVVSYKHEKMSDDTVPKRYRIDSSQSGPALHLTFFSKEDGPGCKLLGVGKLEYEYNYFIPETHIYYPPPQLIIEDFRMLRKMMRGRMNKRYILAEIEGFWGEALKLDKEPHWICEKAYKLLEENENVFLEYPKKHWWKCSDLAISRKTQTSKVSKNSEA